MIFVLRIALTSFEFYSGYVRYFDTHCDVDGGVFTEHRSHHAIPQT